MGQYFIAVNVDDMEHVDPHKYDNGAKLMEHSYITNRFVEAVEFLLIDDGVDKSRWAGKRIVWAGDYADAEPDGHTLYNKAEGDGLQMLLEGIPADYKYIVNHDKKLFVDKTNCPKYGERFDWQIHPLPLLTAEGNGNGGGDYNGPDPNDLVGSWARNRIAVMKQVPEGYTELTPNFTE